MFVKDEAGWCTQYREGTAPAYGALCHICGHFYHVSRRLFGNGTPEDVCNECRLITERRDDHLESE